MLGAYLLDRLGPDERVGLEAHLDGCADCRGELAELRPVAVALPAADPAHLGTPPTPPAELADRVYEHVRSARRSAARRRWAMRGVAALAAAALALSIAIVVRPEQSRPDREEFAFQVVPAGVIAKAILYKRTTIPGVEVWLEVDGLTAGKTYAVWVERANGERVRCGTFDAVQGGETHVVLPSTVRRVDTAAVGVSDTLGHVLMRAAVTGPRTA